MSEILEEIQRRFYGKLIGTKKLKHYVSEVVSTLPEDIQDDLIESCWFVGSMKDAWAYTFTGNDLKNQHLIFLSDDLLSQDPIQIRFSIAHEIGHVIKGHRNSIEIKQSKEEVTIQEKEADEFASAYFPRPS
ncbi:MAG TPA: ImmA/IrrE family metallo-endopeptidase [Patescibacteria group bacterium]